MLAKNPHKKNAKRIGRGTGSGRGKTSGKGHKGQKARSGASHRAGFEGGQNPLYRRLPIRGFKNPCKKQFVVINLDRLQELNLDEISPQILIEAGIINNVFDGLKVLARGELTKKLMISAHRFSDAAKSKIEAAGGKALVLSIHKG